MACASITINLVGFVVALTFLSGPNRSALLSEEGLAEVELNRGQSLRQRTLPAPAVTASQKDGVKAAAAELGSMVSPGLGGGGRLWQWQCGACAGCAAEK